MFEVLGWHKEAYQDDFYRGETGKNVSFHGTERFSASTLDGLIAKLQAFFWCSYIQIGVNEPDEIVMERIEDNDGTRVARNEPLYQRWENGECHLWVARYYFTVEEVDRKPATLEENEYELETVV